MLSGMNQLCSGVLNSSKYRQVRSVTWRRNNLSLADTSLAKVTDGRFSQEATGLLHAHRTRIGIANGRAAGRADQTNRPIPKASTGTQFRQASTGVRVAVRCS